MFLMTPMDGLDRCGSVSEESMIADLGLRTLPEWLTAIYEHVEGWRLAVLGAAQAGSARRLSLAEMRSKLALTPSCARMS